MRTIALALCCLTTPALADGFGFMTPSTNIYCNGSVEQPTVSCNIIERQGPPAFPAPAGCTGVWGHSFTLRATGPVEMDCLERIPGRVNYTDIAPYGVSADFGSITCRSERTGFECTNLSGHGFFLSRRTQAVY